MMKKSIVIIFYSLLFLTSCKRQKRVDLYVLFDRVDNITVGSEVKMNGYLIGEVIGLKLLDNGVLVSIGLNEQVSIPTSSGFSISSPLVGAPVINIEPSSEKKYLTSKDTASGKYEDKGVLDKLMSDSTNKKKIQEALDKIGEGIKELIEARKDSSGK